MSGLNRYRNPIRAAEEERSPDRSHIRGNCLTCPANLISSGQKIPKVAHTPQVSFSLRIGSYSLDKFTLVRYKLLKLRV